MSVKQVIVVRTDLQMGAGKIAAQVAHASREFIRQGLGDWYHLIDNRFMGSIRLSPFEYEWLVGDRVTIVVEGDDFIHLRQLEEACKLSHIKSFIIWDQGRTEVPAGTPTALGIGPAESNKIDEITKKLKLLR